MEKIGLIGASAIVKFLIYKSFYYFGSFSDIYSYVFGEKSRTILLSFGYFSDIATDLRQIQAFQDF
ncbi:MAG: hypothetical protein HW387_1246 [Parachlamydiales bacterium]|nr:hypothetical protein [Parachlamydiales bacterium]